MRFLISHPDAAVLPFPTETPMLDDGEEGGVRLWHLVKANDESELPKHRRGSVREKGGERAKAIPEIYLTRLLSMKVTKPCGKERHLSGVLVEF